MRYISTRNNKEEYSFEDILLKGLADDGGLYTVKVNSYWANDFGLYNMSGNVAEWTANAFEENVNSFEHDFLLEPLLSPNF